MARALARSVLVPDYGRIDLAYEHSIVTPAFVAGLVALHVVAAENFEIPISVVLNVLTDATVVDRVPTLLIQDADQNVLYQIMANGVQAASLNMRHLFYVDAGQSYFAGPANSVTVLPYALLQPGYRMFLMTSNFQAGDRMLGTSMVVQAIPTGPALSDAEEAQPILLT